jgi:hypothetical protein
MKLALTIIAIFLFSQTRADLGPKPTIEITFTDKTELASQSEKDYSLLQCETSDCKNSKRMEPAGPQNFGCFYDNQKHVSNCSGMAYGFTTYLRLKISLNKKTYTSNVFKYSEKLSAKIINDKLNVFED